MYDVRIERWAHTLVHYSLAVKPGETVAIHASPLAAPLVEAVYRELLHVGAHPLPMIDLEYLDEMLLREGNDEQLKWLSPVASMLAEVVDARLYIGAQENTKALSGIDPARAALRRETLAVHRQSAAGARAGGKVPLVIDTVSYQRLCPGR